MKRPTTSDARGDLSAFAPRPSGDVWAAHIEMPTMMMIMMIHMLYPHPDREELML
jgi:hypothetical protein